MNKKLALFCSFLPDSFLMVFDKDSFCPPDWDFHYYTTDHEELGRMSDLPFRCAHYFAFPEMAAKQEYDCIIYIIMDEPESSSFISLMQKYPGIVFLETPNLHESFFCYCVQHAIPGVYVGEMALNNGQRGYCAAQGLLREGKNPIVFDCLQLIETFLKNADTILLAPCSRSVKKQILQKKERHLHVVPPPLNYSVKSTCRKKGRTTPDTNMKIGLVGTSELFYLQQQLSRSLFRTPSLKNISMETESFIIQPLFSSQNVTAQLTEIRQDFEHFLQDKDVLISWYKASHFLEFELLTRAINEEVLLIVHSQSMLSRLFPKDVLTYYRGNGEIDQVTTILENILADSNYDTLFSLTGNLKNRYYSMMSQQLPRKIMQNHIEQFTKRKIHYKQILKENADKQFEHEKSLVYSIIGATPDLNDIPMDLLHSILYRQ